MHQEMYTDAWEKPSGSSNDRRWEELLIEIYTTDEKIKVFTTIHPFATYFILLITRTLSLLLTRL